MVNLIMKKKFNNFILKIGLASDSVIRGWSSGEVKKAETVNYKTHKPISEGLFCEKIFGPIKTDECSCGRYKRFRNRGKICERCQVLVTDATIRRERMGHIELEDPIVHIWYYRSIPSKLALFLNLSPRILEEIIHFDSYALTNNGGLSELSLGRVLSLKSSSNFAENTDSYQLVKTILQNLLLQFPEDSPNYSETSDYLSSLDNQDGSFFVEEFIHFINQESEFKFETGALAIEELLKAVNLKEEISLLKNRLVKLKKNSTDTSTILKRLEILNSFVNSGQKPEWMVTRTIPVLPPDLRPITFLDGDRPAASSLNRLYSELLIRKGRLQKSKDKGAPSFMLNELKRLIQEAADTLFDNSLISESRKKTITAQNFKSIATNLKGKTGRFRQNLLGKRVDYSAGSVITGGPELKLDECGLPRDIAVVLFRPFIISLLLDREIVLNKKLAEKMIDERQSIVWDLLEEIIVGYPIILNRAPTLHRLGIQAFYPKLIRGQAIMLHPLVTTAFNADFDGDRMPMHLPLTDAAKKEAQEILLSTKNILNPRNGDLIMMPTQDIILGLYYLTFEVKGMKGEGIVFADLDSAMLAYWNHKITLHTLIFFPVEVLEKNDLANNGKQLVLTTVGKMIFNRVFGSHFSYITSLDWKKPLDLFPIDSDLKNILDQYQVQLPINKQALSEIINHFLQEFDFEQTTKLLDQLKDLGFKYSTYSGATISLFDLWNHHVKKEQLFVKTEDEVDKIRYFLQIGALTLAEKQNQKIKKWTRVKEKLEANLKVVFDDLHLDQPIRLMVDSGARGSLSNFTQLVGMRGLMINTKGQVIDTPIKSSLTEGLSVLEYYVSTYGARKGMVDTALKTANSGYLTRRLVDATQDFYTVIDDCQTKNFFTVKAIKGKMNSVLVSLAKRIYGRFSAENIFSPDGELLVATNQLITKKITQKIVEAKIKEVKIRSVLTCDVVRGVCCFCYGLDLAKNKLIEKRQAVGVLASQSIGEPATQLTMRTFHTGGVSDASDITQGLPRVIELFDVVAPKQKEAILAPFDGYITQFEKRNDWSYQIGISEAGSPQNISFFKVEQGINFLVKIHDKVKRGAVITEGPINLHKLLAITHDIKIVADYIINQVQNVYCLQGIDIADKYIEIVVAKMLSRSQIVDPGDSETVTGQTMETYVLVQKNKDLLAQGLKLIQFVPIICGVKTIATKTNSFLAAASFQETTKVLIQAAIENRIDPLYGLKENVIVGNIIPVGTGYQSLDEQQSSDSKD